MEQQQETLQTTGVVEKYQEAGKIANNVLQQLIGKITPGARIIDLTQLGDIQIEELSKKAYAKKKNMQKGIAFPTCISVNEICGHYSPLISDANEKEQDRQTLKEGDVVKIDLGVHIDGFMALVGHTVVCQAVAAPVTGQAADVILAAYKGVQGALRLLKAGNTNQEITALIPKITEAYKVNALEGVQSHDVQKHNIDGEHAILQREHYEQKVDKHEFQVNEVYALNIIVSSGEGKPKEADLRTTVYKRAIERQFQLKTQKGRQFYHEITEKYPTLCFSIRSFEDEITAKLGVSECQKHELLNSFPVLTEKPGNIVASFNITALILQGGTVAISGLPIDEANFKTENAIQDQAILDLLALSMDKKEQKKLKKAQKQE